MTYGLMGIILLVVLYGVYGLGVNHGVFYADTIWRAWIAERLKVQSRPAVDDLYPEKKD